jgi:Icc-related predicted phosphoesterase
VSDLHYALKQYDWTASVAANFDVVIIAGDQLDIAGQLDGRVQIVVILKYLRRLAQSAKLIVSSGNHDLDARDVVGEKVATWMRQVRELGALTDGDSAMLEDTLVTICPWWDGPQARETVETQLAADAAKPKRRWVWVYHAPPADSPTSWNGRRCYGDSDLSTWINIYKPDLVLSGHIHEAPFKAEGSWADRIGHTWVFNAGRQIGPTPTHIMIDTGANEAAWFSLAGAEWIALDAPLSRPFAELENVRPWQQADARSL